MVARVPSDLLSELAHIGSAISGMVEYGKIDALVTDRLSRVVESIEKKEEEWRNRASAMPEGTFAAYHAWRNLRLVACKMQNRFLKALGKHENPTTAVDSLKVFPAFFEVCAGLCEMEGRKWSGEDELAMLSRITDLRNIAYHANMLPSLDEELREVSRREVLSEFERFAAGIRVDQHASKSRGRN